MRNIKVFKKSQVPRYIYNPLKELVEKGVSFEEASEELAKLFPNWKLHKEHYEWMKLHLEKEKKEAYGPGGFDVIEPDRDPTARLTWWGAGYTHYDWPEGQSPFTRILPVVEQEPAFYPRPFQPHPSTTVYYPREHEMQEFPLRYPEMERAWGTIIPFIPYWAFTIDMLHKWVASRPESYYYPIGLLKDNGWCLIWKTTNGFKILAYTDGKKQILTFVTLQEVEDWLRSHNFILRPK